MSVNKYVFVVCGAQEHLDTMHFSIRYLKYFSKNEVIVVTDSSRNKSEVQDDRVIDIRTPEHFTNHQASIYLKTGLHRFLPRGANYCYLDTDVIALSEECDDIFNYKKGLVTFAADHCRLPKFSPNAVRCDCLKKNAEEIAELEALMEKYDPVQNETDPVMQQKKQNLIRKFEVLKQNKLRYALMIVRFVTTINKFKLDEDIYYDRWKKIWIDKEGRVIIKSAENMFTNIENVSHWRWNPLKRRWMGPDGRDVFNLECYHLIDYIFNRFGIKVKDKNFQHWNGGVFLFDDSSYDFLESWFQKSMKIFSYPEWLTRDQGTLIANVWEYGLQNNPLLPQKFNFIADWNNPLIMVDREGNFSTNAFKTKVKPAFIHIYHNFGNRGWDVWNYVENMQSGFSPRNNQSPPMRQKKK